MNDLIEKARLVQENAYTPIKDIKVGAALRTSTGEIFTGCNVQNSSYGATICAEHVAIAKMVSEGYRNIAEIAVVSNLEDFITPCGICRQVIHEFSPNARVISTNLKGEIKEYSIKELLPEAFKL